MTEDSSEICLPPSAVDLLESMRAIGYSFEAALADIIDNSISADAKSVEVRFSPHDNPYVAILDNGTGMVPDDLTAAMRHGSKDPNTARAAGDLGRFGLGLKTASLSQCRQLTVASKRDGKLSARCWDLDHVALRQDWMLLQRSSAEIARLPLIEELHRQPSGTLVVWQGFDRLAAGETSIERALGNRMDLAREHLALVFHRVLTHTPADPAVTIAINKNPVRPVDPFLTTNKATQALPPEDFTVQEERVRVSPFILPHISKLSAADLALAGGEEGLRHNQGFYVYRNRRLISWGSWFRLVRQEELTKLARVQVDISNRLDHLWKLDIKKSATYPPEALREGLRQIISRITDSSKRVYTYRGTKSTTEKVVHAWDRTIVRDGVTYRINRTHPVIEALRASVENDQQGIVDEVLRVLEEAVPFDAIYLDMASEVRPATTPPDDECAALRTLALQILNSLGRNSTAGQRFLASLSAIEPFSLNPDVAQDIAQELSHG